MQKDSQTATPVRTEQPKALSPMILVLCVLLSIFGAIVGIQVLSTLGITPSTSLIGALVAMTLARIPFVWLRTFKSVHSQNLVQTSISSATFGAANSLFLPIGIPALFGLPNMIVPMLIGVSCAMLWDAWLLYRLYDTPAFPARNPWPLGVAAAEAIKAGDQGGKRALVLGGGLVTGVLGAWLFGFPMSAFGVALLAGVGAMIAFAAGLLTIWYLPEISGWDLAAASVPHGMMIGAGIVALVQVGLLIMRRRRAPKVDAASAEVPAAQGSATQDAATPDSATPPKFGIGRTLAVGGIGYIVIAVGLALATGLVTQMSIPMLIGFVIYASLAAFVHELIVGIAAMHAGWFPAFAVALITLIIGIFIGFPPEALVVLAGFTAATGPAFADMGYDLKAGSVLREGLSREEELEGRRQQLIAAMIGFGVAITVVAVTYQGYFEQELFAPINEAYVAAINAGVSAETAMSLLLWAIPGAALQLIGGSRRQLGIMFATGLLIPNPWAGWMVTAGLIVRLAMHLWKGKAARESMEIFAGGAIAGDALFGFTSGVIKTIRA